MPNGYHGSAERWHLLVAPLVAVDGEIEKFARQNGMSVERDGHSWPGRHLHWSTDLDRSIEIYLNPDEKTYRVGVSGGEDRDGQRYWRSEVIADVTGNRLQEEVSVLLERALARVVRWNADDLELAGRIR